MMAIVICIVWSIIFPVDIHFYRQKRFWTELLTYPCWGLVQQYIALAFFFRRLKEIFFPQVFPAVFFSATIFSAAHIPNFPLMIFCFLTGLLWSWAYHRHCNLLTIAICHGVLGAICSNLLMMYMMAGPFADPARWTVVKPVLAYLDRVNTNRPDRDFPLVKIQKQEKSIVVFGWAKGIDKDIEKIFVSFAGKDHLAHYGIERKDVAVVYKDPDYTHTGFRVQIPISHLEPDYYLLRLKIKLSSRNICHYPHRTVWVKIL